MNATNPAERAIRLSLSMIVRDSIRTLEQCLQSIRPWVDEMIVVDTGSVDDTPELARRMGARVFHFPWCDSFAAARNESLRHACGEWILWMDADDTIDAENASKLRNLVDSVNDPDVMGIVMQVHCPGPPTTEAELTVVDHVKIIRNRPGLRFDGRIHEQVLPAIRRLGGQVAWSDIFVVHSGYDHSPAGQARKRKRDLHLLHLEHRERPNHPFTLFNLGMTYTDIGEYSLAADYLRQSIEYAKPTESHVRKSYALLIFCLRRMNQLDEAWQTCQRGLALYPQDAELLFRAGVLLFDLGRYDDSITAYQAAIDSKEAPHFSSVDPAIKGFKALQNQAVVYAAKGDLDLAELKWRQVLAEIPDNHLAWRGLGEALLRQGKKAVIRTEASRLAAHPNLQVEAHLLRAQWAQSRDEWREACCELQAASAANPADIEPLRRRCRILYDHGTPSEAGAALQELLAHDPSDGSTHHNLGNLFLTQCRYEDAVRCFEESLATRQECIDTMLNLGHALVGCDRLGDALDVWERALLIDPSCVSARDALSRYSPLASVNGSHG